MAGEVMALSLSTIPCSAGKASADSRFEATVSNPEEELLGL